MNNILIYLLSYLIDKHSSDDLKGFADAYDDKYRYEIEYDEATNQWELWSIPYDANQDCDMLYEDKNIDKIKSFLIHHLLDPIGG